MYTVEITGGTPEQNGCYGEFSESYTLSLYMDEHHRWKRQKMNDNMRKLLWVCNGLTAKMIKIKDNPTAPMIKRADEIPYRTD